MAVPAERFRSIAGGRSRPADDRWSKQPLSKLQRYVVAFRMQLRSENLRLVSDPPPERWKGILNWLTRPSEFVELREADAALKLLAPTVPARCLICNRPDWLNQAGMCPSCWLRWDGISKWVAAVQERHIVQERYGGS